MHKKFQDLLHEYKVELFHKEHDKQNLDDITRECLQISEEVLQQNYHYHFHKLPDADRAEIINMINNYTREAVLPPLVEKLVQRQVIMERRFESMQKLVTSVLDLLSKEPTPV